MKETSKKPNQKERRIERRSVNALKPHPAQDGLFDDHNAVEIRELARDMQQSDQPRP